MARARGPDVLGTVHGTVQCAQSLAANRYWQESRRRRSKPVTPNGHLLRLAREARIVEERGRTCDETRLDATLFSDSKPCAVEGDRA